MRVAVEAAVPDQDSVWAAASPAVEELERADQVEGVAAQAALEAELMQEICGVRREPVAAVAEWPEEAEVEPAQAAPVVSEVEALELAQAV